MSKIERLLNLTAVLLETKRPLSAKEIKEKIEGYSSDFDNFLRMFERDKEDLRSMGVPLEVATSYTGDSAREGYIIKSDDYYLPDLRLSEDELNALNLAVLSIQIDGIDDLETIWKLGGLSSSVNESDFKLANLSFHAELTPLFNAITSNKIVKFNYKDKSRIVSPWLLDFRRGRWYLVGYDHTKSSERNFRVDRLQSEVQLDDDSKLVYKKNEQKSKSRKPWEFGDNPVNVLLWVSSERKEYVKRLLGPEVNFYENPDGSVVFNVKVSNFEPFRAFVLDLLDHAEIVGPDECRNDMKQWLEKTVELYA